MIENMFYHIKIDFGAQFYFHVQTICVDQDSGKLIYNILEELINFDG